MRSPISNKTLGLQKYLKSIVEQYSNDYNAILCEVVSYDNCFVKVKILNADNIITEINNIPIIANKYSRPFVQQGDLGILLNIHTDIYNTLIGLENSYQDTNSYVFLPIIYQNESVDGNNNGNVKIDISPDGANNIQFSNDGLNATLKQHNENITNDLTINADNSNITAKSDIKETAQNITNTASASIALTAPTISISSQTPITIKSQGESSNLGALLVETLEAIITALNDAGVPQIIEHTAYQNANLPGDISTIESLIARLKKVLQ